MSGNRAGSLAQEFLANMPKYGAFHPFSAEAATKALVRAVEELEANAPEGKLLILNMPTPDGRMMLIETIEPRGFGLFLAKGRIEHMVCAVLAHISTINLFGVYDEPKGRSKVGFVFQAEPTDGTVQSE